MSALRGLVIAVAIQVVTAGAVVAPFAIETRSYAHDDVTVSSVRVAAMPACRYEDGNPDGSPCTWFDPDTGDGYDVGSENYRDE